MIIFNNIQLLTSRKYLLVENVAQNSQHFQILKLKLLSGKILCKWKFYVMLTCVGIVRKNLIFFKMKAYKVICDKVTTKQPLFGLMKTLNMA